MLIREGISDTKESEGVKVKMILCLLDCMLYYSVNCETFPCFFLVHRFYGLCPYEMNVCVLCDIENKMML